MDILYCEVCGTTKQMKKHQQSTHDERSFKCDHCDKEVSVRGMKNLKKHLDSHKTITCKLCGLAFTKNSRAAHRVKCSSNIV